MNKTRLYPFTVAPLLLVIAIVASCSGGGGGGLVVNTGPAKTSAQIQAARDAANGPVSLPIASAIVTYVTSSYSAIDPAGFFIQAEKTGPALFVAVDPATLTPGPATGDVVDLTITEMSTSAAARWASAITGFSRTGQGAAVAALKQDVSATTDLVTSIGNYESEVLAASGTISSIFSAAGTSFVQATIDTAGIAGNANLRLRMPDSLQTALAASHDLMAGCVVTLPGTPLWRFNASAQLMAWTGSDIVVDICPAPKVVSATTPSSAVVRVAFSRAISPASITNAAAQFTFNNGLTASAAAVNNRTVDVTTSAQTPGQSYTVTVAGTVTDVMGSGIDGVASSATFTGFSPPAAPLYFSEYVEGTASNKALEIWNFSPNSVDLTACSIKLYTNGSTTATATITFIPPVLAANSTHVVCNSSAGGSLVPSCNAMSTLLTFNGDDALELVCNGQTVDTFGQIGSIAWGGLGTSNITLRRKSTVTSGDIVGTDVFDPAVEWDSFPVDTFSGLGTR